MNQNQEKPTLNSQPSTVFKINKRSIVIVFLAALMALMLISQTFAHGSMETPISRIYQCRKEGPERPKSAACKAAVQVGGTQALYDWNGVNQLAGGNHKAFVPDGQLCSGGNEKFKGMDLARNDWVAQTIAPDNAGNYEFIYHATAPHSTAYFKFYVTKDGYDPLQPLKWSDLEDPPFCTITSISLQNNRYHMTCPLPKNKSGKHVIYSVWQRNDSAESFYSCSDVKFNGSTTAPPTSTPAPTPTPRPISSFDYHTYLPNIVR